MEDELRTERVLTIGVMVLAAIVGTVLVAWAPGEPGTRSVAVAAAGGVTATIAPTTSAPTRSVSSTVTRADTTTTAPSATTTSGAVAATPSTDAPDPGLLPQTDTKPEASGATFTAGVDGLWEAIRQDKPELGLPFFFPKSAYLQVKAISDAAGDYQNRLIANYEDDIHALHAQLGPNAANAALVGIDVPGDQAVWVQPGEEYNQLSYWRVYGTTLQYQVDGRTGSFPVTSLISWRGEWYVVHLGAIR